MSGSIIAAVQNGDLVEARALLDAGNDIHTRDEHEWTPLNWAAGRGDLEMVQLLIERGADVYRVGRDQRTPYLIALAAGHAKVARFLRSVEARGGDASQSSGREKVYCKAYYLKELRRWPGWAQLDQVAAKAAAAETSQSRELEEEAVVFVHQDFTVTKSMWHGEDVLLGEVTPEWRQFCEQELGFFVPDDIDLIEAENQVETESSVSAHSPEAYGHEAR